MPSLILDAYGKPATLRMGSGVLFGRDAADIRNRPVPRNHFDDYMALLGGSAWKRLVSEGRAVSSKGIVAACIMQRADYISGSQWRVYFEGEDDKYGQQAEELLENTNTVCCTRGPRYDWRTLWKLGVMTAPPDGGFFILLTENERGWPLLQPIEAHRVGQRDWGEQVVKMESAWTAVKSDEGILDFIPTPYYGMKIVNGIIYNKAGCEVAYRVLGATVDDDEDISARDMIHVAAPKWFSEGRPVPTIAPSLLDLLGVEVARSAQLDQQINHSKLNLIETNETGRQETMRGAMNPPPFPATENGGEPEILERGTIRFVKKNGGKIEAHKADVPSNQWMQYDDKVLAAAISALPWRIEMLDVSKLSGNGTRAFMDQINTNIINGFLDFAPAARRCARYRIAKFTKLGMLPEHPEFLRFGVTPPPEFKVDRNSDKVDVDNVRAGADNMPNIMRKNGLRARDSLIAQAKFVRAQMDIAAEFQIPVEKLGNLTVPGSLPPEPAADTEPKPKPDKDSP